MNRRFPHPLGQIDSMETAVKLTRYSSVAFILWALVLGLQAIYVGASEADTAPSTLAFLVFQGLLALGAALFQWRRPNRVLPAFGLAWSLYELSSVLVGLLVGMPMAIGDLPNWVASLTSGMLLVCAIAHIGGLRGAMARSRMSEA